MKISQVTTSLLCQQLRENEDALSQNDKDYIQVLYDAAVTYIQGQTGIHGVDVDDESGRKLDDYPDLTYALLALVSDMYDNRQMTVSSDKANETVLNILSRHDFNLIPKGAEPKEGEYDERWSV